MISYIRGELAFVDEDKIIVDVGGVGYGIFMPGRLLANLPRVGQEIKVYTYLNVKEDAMQLFGFLSQDDLKVYKLVISVNGIGPKGGLSIMSQLSANDLRFAVLSNDVKAISAAQGIGKKTAEKLILELKDKLKLEDAIQTDDITTVTSSVDPSANAVQQDAVEALVALGYGNTEALKAVRQVDMSSAKNVEDVLKNALKYLF